MIKAFFTKFVVAPFPRFILIIILVAAIPFLCFYRVKDYDFISLDDGPHILNNPHMERVTKSSILSFWEKPYLKLYIPMSYTAWSFLKVLSTGKGAEKPVNPVLFHVANLFLHLINSILVFFLLRMIVYNDWAAFLGSLVFSLHPVQIESVAWISEFRGLLSTTFVLGAILVFMREMRKNSVAELSRNRWNMTKSTILLSSAALLFICALLCKPSAITAPFIAGTLAYRLKSRRRIFFHMGLWIILAIPIMLITSSEQKFYFTIPPWQRPFIFLDAIGFYVAKIIFPQGLCIDYGRAPDMVMQNYSWLPLSLLAFSALLLILMIRKRIPGAARAALIFFFALFPVSGMKPFLFQYYSTVADRYLYLPMIGVALLASLIFTSTRRIAIAAVAGVWIVFVVVIGVQQLTTWENSSTLYNHALKINPNSYLSLNNLGNIFAGNKYYKAALFLYREAIIKKPNFSLPYYNSALIFKEMGNYPGAINFCARALFFRPDYREVHEMLAAIYVHGGKYQAAMENYKRALILAASTDKCTSELNNNIAVQYLLRGKKTIALQYLSDAISCNPKEVFARLNRGRIFQESGRCGEAEKDYKDVLKIEPANTFAKEQLAHLSCDSVKIK